MDLGEMMAKPGVLPTDPGRNKVMVVDDDVSYRMLLVRLLRGQGYECQPASSTQEARDHLKSASYALVVTDMRMFAEDGIELVRHVADRYPDTAVIVVTGLALADIEDQLRRAGAVAVIAKPVDKAAFAQVVEDAMEQRQAMVEVRRHKSP